MANRRSARESRERRKKRLDFLEKTFQELSQEHALVLRENRSLRQQISSLLPHVDMASYRRHQRNDLSMMTAAGGMASAPSQYAPMGGIGGLGAGMGLPPALPPALRLSGMPQLPSNYLNQQSLAMSQPSLGSASYHDQEQLGNLPALQKGQGMHGPYFLP
jgi:bZIP transcription factor